MPCRTEHEFLLALAHDPELEAKGVTLIGVAQKDPPENVRRFLGALGDPYAKVGLDGDGRAGIDWGVYGVPETFVVRGDGVIAFKQIGPIDAAALQSVVKPAILKAANAGGAQLSTRGAAGISSENAGTATSNTSPSSAMRR